MKKTVKTLLGRVNALFATAVLVGAQIAAPLVLFVPQASAVVNECVVDTAGANDEPGQKDLTKLCVDDTPVSSVNVTWNWDELGTSGENTMDACALFDTDDDGLINYSVCAVTNDTPATLTATVLYSCGDDKPDRCTSPVTPLTISNGTNCTIDSPVADDPFIAGADYPNDTQASCQLFFADVGGVGNAELIDVCSYPSQQPNSDPSDCVIIKDNSAFIKLVKEIEPASDPGLFDLYIDGELVADDVSDGGNSGFVTVDSDSNGENFVVSELAGTGTVLANYQSEVQCVIEGISGSVIQNTSTTINLEAGETATCTFTNTINPGSITIVKNTVGEDGTFNFTSDFGVSQLITSGGTASQTVNDLNPDTYSIAEVVPDGWKLNSASCDDQSDPSAIVLSAGEDVTCTFTNTKQGSITIVKNTVGGDDTFDFTSDFGVSQLTTSGNTATQTINNLDPDTYSISEIVPEGWYLDSATCDDDSNPSSINLSAGEDVTCTFTNTQLGKITVIKQTLPDGSQQSFEFNPSWSGDNFNLIDGETEDSPFLYPGTYDVNELLVGGWSLTSATCDDGSEVSSINLAAGETVTCTFVNTQLGSISGYKYNVDLDGTQLGGLEDWTIKIFADGGLYGQTTTDSDGYFLFDGLLPDDYTVEEVNQNGWTQLTFDGVDDTCNDTSYFIELNAGEDSTNNDFCNFQNGSISGYKWNDINGDGLVSGESRLSGWTIFLDENNNQQLDAGEEFTTTDVDGNYEFTNLEPGTYTVCEVMQTNWVQTYPATQTGCSSTTINQSGDSATKKFGNQARGTIKVIKNVINDHNGPLDYSDFSFDLDSEIDFDESVDVTGNYGFSQDGADPDDGATTILNVPVGTYNVTEPEANQNGYSTSYSDSCDELTVTIGQQAVCTITNNDNPGTIHLIKRVVNNNGGEAEQDEWTLKANGPTNVSGTDTSANPDSGFTAQVNAGTYTLSEENGPSGYTWESIQCGPNVNSLSDAADNKVTIGNGETVYCVFTNDDVAPTLTLVKHVTNDNGGTAEPSSWTLSATPVLGDVISGNGYDGVVKEEVEANTEYELAEDGPDGYMVSEDWSCDGGEFDSEKNVLKLTVGTDVTCEITNDDIAPKLTIKKIANSDSGELEFDFTGDLDEFSLMDQEKYSDDDLSVGTYEVKESDTTGWKLGYIYCYGTEDWQAVWEDETLVGVEVDLELADQVKCKFYNDKLGEVNGHKFEDINGNGYWDEEEPTLEGWTINLVKTCNVYSVVNLQVSNDIAVQQEQECEDEVVDSTVTDENGAYKFENIDFGDYKVCEEMQDGWMQTYPMYNEGCHIFYVEESGHVEEGKDFGNFQKGSVSGYKFGDYNDNGVYDEGDLKLSNWEITLYKFCPTTQELQLLDRRIPECEETTKVTHTDNTGHYSFGELEQGDYKVCETQQDGWHRTYPNESNCHEFSIETSGQNYDANFGNAPNPGEVLAKTGASTINQILASLSLIILTLGLAVYNRKATR